jgi:hypothetical protein
MFRSSSLLFGFSARSLPCFTDEDTPFFFLCLQLFHTPVPWQIHQHGAKGSATTERSGKGNDVAIIPSPKNRTGKFLYIRLKPFSPPVLPDAVSQRVDLDYELGDDR